MGYFYHKGTVYIPTVAKTKKARNIERNSRCCIVTDVVEDGIGRGVMLQGEAQLVKGVDFPKMKRIIEELSGWHLDKWRINGRKPDSVLVFTPEKTSEIGHV